MPAQPQPLSQPAAIPTPLAKPQDTKLAQINPKSRKEPRNPWPKTADLAKAKRRKSVSSRSFKKQMVAGQEPLRKFAIRLCKREDMAEDLMQETLMKAWAARDQFKPGSNFLSWSFTILRNTWLNQVRREKKFVAEFDEQAAENILSAPPAQMATLELADLQRAMSELPTDQLEAVMLVGPGDMTYDEAGEILGVAAGTVKSRASRARATLGDIFDGGRVKMAIAQTEGATDIAETFVGAIKEIEQGGSIENVINLEQSG